MSIDRKLAVPRCYLEFVSDRTEKLLTWAVLVAAVASVPATYWHSSKGSMHDVGLAIGWLIWLVFATEVVVMLNISDDPRAWMRGHQFELFVTITSFPILLDLPGVREVIGVFPLLGSVKLLKALKILKLAKVFKLLHASSLSGWMVRIVSVAAGFVVLGLVGSMVSSKKVKSPGDGVDYLADEVSDVVGAGSTIVVLTIIALLFGLVEWWAWRQRTRTITASTITGSAITASTITMDARDGRSADAPTNDH
jgi:hypothetical protein